MKVLDLFAGIGGFSLAAHWMGWETVAFVEKEPFCHKVLNKNFPGVPIYDDIFTFSGQPFRGTVDIITGGFPCQPFSAAGKRKGRDDERHLFPEMLRVIREVRPRFVVAENVRGLLSIESGSVFAEVTASLEGEGYEVITFCVSASALGAPHRRDRLWIVATYNPLRAGCGEYDKDASVPSGNRSNYRLSKSSDRDAAVGVRSSQPSDAGSGGSSGSRELGRSVYPASSGDRQVHRTLNEDQFKVHWLEAATRFCGVDDDVSDELDIAGSRDNRAARLKALGNAIVPGIAYEIFRAIAVADNNGSE